ncbi:MAG: hypothetical protein WBV94_25165 [Blastocatellia bacterium]
MAIINKLIKTQYGALTVSLLKCDHCGDLTTEESAIGWIRQMQLGPQDETFGSVDLSGEYCSQEHILAAFAENGVIALAPTATDNEESQETGNDENG